MLKIPMTWPEREGEIDLARRMLGSASPESTLERGEVRPVLRPGELAAMKAALTEVGLREELLGYIVDIVRRTRSEESVLVGGGPRATQALLAASRAQAALSLRDFVTPDDVKAMAIPVLEHRLILRPEFEIEGLTGQEVIGKILQSVAVPV